jgi:hypothetical protein
VQRVAINIREGGCGEKDPARNLPPKINSKAVWIPLLKFRCQCLAILDPTKNIAKL